MLFRRFLLSMALLAGLLAVPCSRAQQQAPDGASGMTLHVTVRELQVAALVLDMHRHAVAGIDRSRFRLQVDSGSPFLPTTVHRAGDDPISIAVVLDLSEHRHFQDELPKALAAMRENLLRPQDRLLLFAVDCSLVSYRDDTGTPEAVRKGVGELINNPRLHLPGKPGRTCSDQLHLWDSAMMILKKLSTAPGRHAMLLVTDGRDTSSITPMFDLARLCTITATTLFALPPHDMLSPNGPKTALEILAAKTGGQLLDAPSRNDIARSFAECMSLLRERYILSFNQPQNAKSGEHIIQASVQRGGFLIRTSGVSVPLGEKSETTITAGQDPSKDDPAKP